MTNRPLDKTKREIVAQAKALEAQGASKIAIADHLGIARSTLYLWLKKYDDGQAVTTHLATTNEGNNY